MIGKWLIFQFGPFSTPNKANLLEVQTLWLRNSVWSVRFLWLGRWSPAWKCLLDGLLTCHTSGWSQINLLLKSSYHWQHVQMDHFCDIPRVYAVDASSRHHEYSCMGPFCSPVAFTRGVYRRRYGVAKKLECIRAGSGDFWPVGSVDCKHTSAILCPGFVHPCFTLLIILNAYLFRIAWVLYRCVYPSGPSTQVYHKLSTSAHKHGWGLRDVVTPTANWSEQLRRQSIHWLPLFMYFYVANPTRNHLQFGVIPLYYIYAYIYVHTYTGWWFGTFFIFYILGIIIPTD